MVRSLVKNVRCQRRATPFVVGILVMVAAMVVGYAAKAYAAPGDLDPSFDVDGKLTTDFDTSGDASYDLAVQQDGKTVVAGGSTTSTGGVDFALARYNADGTLDTSFGTGGKVTTPVAPEATGDIAQAVALQPDGKIVVAGYANSGTTTGYDFAVVRYNANGSLDTAFSSDGIVTTPLGTFYDQATDVALQGNKVVVVGIFGTSGGTTNDFALVRYNSNGSLDSTFGTGGVVKTDFFGARDQPQALAVEPGGKIVVAGSTINPNDTAAAYDFALARYNTNGSLDSAFGSGGKVVTHFGFGYDSAYDIAMQEDGKVVAAGNADSGSTSVDFALARYDTDGSLDGEFDGDGKLRTDFFGGADWAEALAIQEDGKMVAAGLSNNGSNSPYDFALARYNADGSLNNSFHNDGKLKTALGGPNDDRVHALALQEDGKIVAAGYAGHSTTGSDFALARYFGGDDATKPVVRPPAQSLVVGSTLGTSTVPTRLTWSATDADGEITRYQLQRSVNGEAYTNVSLPSALTTSITLQLNPTNTYRFRVRATDDNGNTSFYKYGSPFTVDTHQESSTSIAYAGTWTQQSLSGSYGGAVKYATVNGATATLSFTGRNVAWVAPKSNARGKAEVYLDGMKVATVDLYSSTALSRKVLYSANGLNPSVSHTLEIKVLGTKNASSTGTRVDVDAFVVLR